MESLLGIIRKVEDGRGFWAWVDYPHTRKLEKQHIKSCMVDITDGRRLSPEQRTAIHATVRDISIYTGVLPEETKEIMKYDFMSVSGCDWFSLSNCDMTTAYRFLQHLIEFCLVWDIPTSSPLIERSPYVEQYIYACLLHKKSCITQKKAELHHVDAVGIGRNRKEILHVGMRAVPLTRGEHNEAHRLGWPAFSEKYHLHAVTLDEELCRVWKLKGE